MAVLAHPDDESLGVGGALARYADEGVRVHLVTATRGERGRYFDNTDRPSDEEVGRVRERELRCAAEALGVHRVALLGYLDRELDRAEPVEATRRIVAHIRRARPHVVITFDQGRVGTWISEPSALALVAVGLAGLAAARRRHRG